MDRQTSSHELGTTRGRTSATQARGMDSTSTTVPPAHGLSTGTTKTNKRSGGGGKRLCDLKPSRLCPGADGARGSIKRRRGCGRWSVSLRLLHQSHAETGNLRSADGPGSRADAGNAAMSQRQKNESVHRSRALRLWRELHGGESVSGWLAQKLQPYWPQPGRFCRTGRAAAR